MRCATWPINCVLKRKILTWYITLTITDMQFSADRWMASPMNVRRGRLGENTCTLTWNIFIYSHVRRAHMLTRHTKQGTQFVQQQLLNSMTNEARNFPAASFSFVWPCVHRGSSCVSAEPNVWLEHEATEQLLMVTDKRNRSQGWDLENKWQKKTKKWRTRRETLSKTPKS